MNEDKLIEQIRLSIKKNGFPDKRVSLPYDKILASVEKLELDIELFLGRFEIFDIYVKIDNNRLIFSSTAFSEVIPTNAAIPDGLKNIIGDTNLDELRGMGKMDLMKKVSEMMKNMSAQQMNQMKDMYANMSPEQQKEVIKKSKDLGL